MAMPAPIYSWNGIYIGANGGYGWSNLDTDSYDDSGALRGSGTQDRSGGFGGGQIGFNYMLNPNWLIGVEGDYDWASLTGSSDSCSSTGCSHSDGKTNWFATARGRVGYVMGDWLIYATGGAAWTHGSSVRTITSDGAATGESTTGTSTHPGWTAGAGVEYQFAPGWSVVAQYLYIQTKGDTEFVYPTSSANRRSDTTSHLNTVRLGLNYRFNWMR